MKGFALSAGRLTYAVSAGLSMLVVSLDQSNLSVVGEYTIQIGIAAAVSLALTLGIDRVQARKVASGEAKGDFSRTFLAVRSLSVFGIITIASLTGILTSQYALIGACTFFILSRLLYADLEMFWIASGRSEVFVGTMIGLNGVLTALAVLFGVGYGASVMVALSAAATSLAGAGLLIAGHWRISRNQWSVSEFKEATGFGLSALLSAIYSRSDLVVLALSGATLELVGVYGVILRVFDALTLIRGSVAQVEMRRFAPLAMELRVSQMFALAKKVAIMAAPIAMLGVVVVAVLLKLPVFEAWRAGEMNLILAAVIIPAFLSHLSTSALVLSDSRSHLLLLGSVITALGSIVIRTVLVMCYGTEGAVFAIGISELFSYLVFSALYARTVVTKNTLPALIIPLASIAIAAALI